jgi:stearoyl-CoA desaturase (delta-9 desaturase)
MLWLTTGQNRREWVAVHRKHHTFTDQEGDPHSPRLFGLWRVQLWNVYYYIREAHNPETLRTFAPDITQDWWDRTIFSWGLSGLGLGIGVLCLTPGVWPGLAAWLVHGPVCVFVVTPLINGFGHRRGAQNFSNTAYNWRALAWVTAGESLHNNHHAHPRAEVQHGAVRVRSLLGGHSLPGGCRIGEDHGCPGPVFSARAASRAFRAARGPGRVVARPRNPRTMHG